MSRRATTVVTALLGLAVAGTGVFATDQAEARTPACKAKTVTPAAVSKRVVVRSVKCLLNQRRTARGLRPLKHEDRQRVAAARHNRLMVRTNCFAHRCQGEGDLVTRLLRADYLPRIGGWGVGENIAWGTGKRSTPKSIVRGWMASPPHRRNILDPKFEHIGIAVHEGTPVAGVRGGATYTTDFGYRR